MNLRKNVFLQMSPSIFVTKLSNLNASHLTLHSWSFSSHDKWLTKAEFSYDEDLYEVKLQVTFPKIANQRIITPIISIKKPQKENEEEILKALLTVKEFSDLFSISFEGKTDHFLADFLNLKLLGI
ncbi:hypothetical protein Anas_04577 [Armadillidium nasatum]|uniref:Uncharacterized protein n=1 Tax=Armadillidium nasatum TaxID=96803 RepID=A0A5N5TIW8_9CRUS|nr:hypothetical protein Anas_04577 [Armadillidium nasatum]